MPKFVLEALGEGTVTLRTPRQNYRHTFLAAPAGLPGPGAPVTGTVRAPAWKIDRVSAGGNYVEPLFGRPRRMQGLILAVNPAANELTVQVGYEVIVQLPPRYSAADFPVGARIGWDNVAVPTFQVSTPPPAAPSR